MIFYFEENSTKEGLILETFYPYIADGNGETVLLYFRYD